MTIPEAKNILINRGFVEINGDQVFDGNKWRNAITVISKWLEQEPCDDWYDVPSDEMTLEQARQAVKDLRKKLAEYLDKKPCDDEDIMGKSIATAFQFGMALGFGEKHDKMDRVMEEVKKAVTPEQQPCDDCISRQAVDELSKELVHTTRDKADFLCNFWEGLQKLPSVTPKEKTGKWIKIQSGDGMFPMSIVCSKCNNENSHLDFNEHAEPIGKVFIKSRYCPNCGAKMQEVEK